MARWIGWLLQAYLVWLILALVLAPLWPDLTYRIAGRLSVANLPVYPSLFSAVLVALVVSAYLRGQRAALAGVIVLWQAPAIVYFAVVVIRRASGYDPGAQIDASDIASLSIAVALTVVLIAIRGAFPARLSHGAWWRAGGVVVLGLLAAACLTFVVVEIVSDSLQAHSDRLGWSFSAVLGIDPEVAAQAFDGSGPRWLFYVASVTSGLALLAAVAVFFRAPRHDALSIGDHDLQVRELLLTHPGQDSLEYFATRDDRSQIFTDNGAAAVSFRVIGGVCLAAGDPLGDPQQWPAAIDRWRAHARLHGWVPAVLSAGERGAQAYLDAGMRPILLGDEAVVDTRLFTLQGPAMHAVRRAVHRAERDGLRVLVRRQDDIPAAELGEIVAAADEWRHGGPERGFSMALGRLGDPRDGRSVIVTAYDPSGALRGILSFVPWARRGLSLDVMRRSPGDVAGINELMISTLIKTSPGMGIDLVSLNFAMFRSSFELGAQAWATPRQRLNRRLLLLASRWWQLDSLYQFNDKYRPQWRPRALCVENTTQLTSVLIAMGRAEGFLPDLGAPAAHIPTEEQRLDRSAAIGELEQRHLAGPVVVRQRTRLEQIRVDKLDLLRDHHMDPYPRQVPRTQTIPGLIDAIAEGVEPAEVSVSGRVLRQRDHGGVLFVDLHEELGQMQVMFTADRPAAGLALWRRTVDIADIVSVSGSVVRSRTGELTVHAHSWHMAAKSVSAAPSIFHGIADPEARLRQRHMDLALNDDTARRLRGRSVAVHAMRSMLHDRDYLEVETPILQQVHGGANARPFATHINAYDLDLSLRIAPELYLKRLCVGGLQKVFELGRNFRNEGVDSTHNPEFTALEAYQAYADYTTMRELARELIVSAAVAVHGRPIAVRPDGAEVRLDGEWPVITVHEAVSGACDRQITPDTSTEDLRQLCDAFSVAYATRDGAGALVTHLYDKLVEASTTTPTFYTDFPLETSPLTRPHRDDPRLAERWDLVAFGAELGTAYSELADPIDQRERLTRQSMLAASGDPEAMELDEDFLRSLEFGMPPTGGLGLGVDRVYMMLTGASIRETLTFPFLRPQRTTSRGSSAGSPS